MTTGTKTAEIRSASRWTAALPFCASSTSRAIWASWVSAPTRVARTTSRPPALTVAPVTGSPGATSTGTRLAGEHRGVDRRGRPRRPRRRWRSSRRAGRRSGRRRPAAPIGTRTSRRPRSTATSLAPRSQQRAQRGAGPALGAGLEVAAGQDERGDAGRDLEVDAAAALAARDGQLEGVPACPACRRRRRTAPTPTSRTRPGCRARPACPWWPRRAAGCVQAARWNGQRRVRHDRRGQRQREPLPVAGTAAPGSSPWRPPARSARPR